MSDKQLNLDSLIPTGPWTIYFHSPEEVKWTLNTFVSLGSMKTWRDFWTIIEGLKVESLSDGMFFMMKDPYPPLWESHYHINGGCYSFRCQKKEAPEICINHMIACMLGCVANNPENKISGLSISPKKGFNIIKIWNTQAQKFKNPNDICDAISSTINTADIMYTRFTNKSM